MSEKESMLSILSLPTENREVDLLLHIRAGIKGCLTPKQGCED
jgi:hypothetical protein